MVANELRIGNSLEFQGVKAKLYGIGKDGFVQYVNENKVYNCGIDEVEPIKIIEEILLSNQGHWHSISSTNDCILIDCTEYISIGWCGYLFLYIEGIMVQFDNANSKYLHQLQNLYFALTGEELNIQL